jgi:hypothetical protein
MIKINKNKHMKNILKSITLLLLSAALITSCEKVDDLTVYNDGVSPVLTSNSLTIAPTVADSASNAVTFNWTSAKYATDSNTVKYTLQIDSAGKSFANPYYSATVTGATSLSLKGSEVTKLLIDKGLAFNTAYNLIVRVISSYANGNEPLTSNIVALKMSAYVIPPKVQLPFTGKLFIVGDGTQGGWNNPVPTPTQEFGKIDSVTYVGVFNMIGSREFLILPENGNWGFKYSLDANNLPGVETSGDFGYNKPSNFKSPTSNGWFKITLDFQRGKYKIQPYVGPEIPANLFIVGNATPGGWNNPVPVPTQQFTRLNSVQFRINSLQLNGTGNEYLMLPVNGDWSNKYAVESTGSTVGTGGFFGYNLGGNFPAPAASGNYKLEVNFGVQKTNATGVESANSAQFKYTKL